MTWISNLVITYTMEMRFLIAKELNMIVGEFGGVELELLLGFLLIFIGCMTPEFFQTHITDTITSLKGNQFADGCTWGHVGGSIFLPL